MQSLLNIFLDHWKLSLPPSLYQMLNMLKHLTLLETGHTPASDRVWLGCSYPFSMAQVQYHSKINHVEKLGHRSGLMSLRSSRSHSVASNLEWIPAKFTWACMGQNFVIALRILCLSVLTMLTNWYRLLREPLPFQHTRILLSPTDQTSNLIFYF